MSAHHYRKIKRWHRYNAREEDMRIAMMLRRSWARYRWHVKKIPGLFSVLPWLVPAPTRVNNSAPGVYVWEWTNDPIDIPPGQG